MSTSIDTDTGSVVTEVDPKSSQESPDLPLAKPAIFKDEKIDKIRIGLDKLSASDLRNIEREYRDLKKGKSLPSDLLDDDDYLLLMHSRTSGLPLEFFTQTLSGIDYLALTRAYRRSLKESGL
jgi:hypothetical protein